MPAVCRRKLVLYDAVIILLKTLPAWKLTDLVIDLSIRHSLSAKGKLGKKVLNPVVQSSDVQ